MRQLICSKCKLSKDKNLFSKKSDSKRGFSYVCKKCHNKYIREIHYPIYKQKQINSSNEWKRKNRIRVLSNTHKIPREFLEKEFNNSNGICKICKKKKKLFIDHCHVENKYRGLICRHCNSLLGFAMDNISTLKEAIKYLLNTTGGR